MRSLKRFMDWSRENIKNKRDLEELEKIYDNFMEDYRGFKRDFILFKNGTMGVVIKELNTVVLDTRENLDLNKLDENLPLEQTIVSIVWRGPLSFKACLNSDNSDKIIFKQTKEEEE